jgi:hypothetical protein
VANKVPAGTVAKMAVPQRRAFQRCDRATGLTSEERVPVLETKNSAVTRARGRSTFAAMDRIDGRSSDQLRPVAFDLGIAPYADGSALVIMGNTRVRLRADSKRRRVFSALQEILPKR